MRTKKQPPHRVSRRSLLIILFALAFGGSVSIIFSTTDLGISSSYPAQDLVPTTTTTTTNGVGTNSTVATAQFSLQHQPLQTSSIPESEVSLLASATPPPPSISDIVGTSVRSVASSPESAVVASAAPTTGRLPASTRQLTSSVITTQKIFNASKGKKDRISPSAVIQATVSTEFQTAIYHDSNNLPKNLRDFPCPTVRSKTSAVLSETVTFTCEVQCDDAVPSPEAALRIHDRDAFGSSSECGAGLEACRALAECDAVLLVVTTDPANHTGVPHGTGGTLGGEVAATSLSTTRRRVAVLKTRSDKWRDNSLQRLTASKWWGSPQLQPPPLSGGGAAEVTREAAGGGRGGRGAPPAAAAAKGARPSKRDNNRRTRTLHPRSPPRPPPVHGLSSSSSSALSSSSGKAGPSTKRRTYVVASYGGCGSKMLSGWLFTLPPQHRAAVLHLHDRFPPQHLHSFAAPPVRHKRAPPGGSKRPIAVASEAMDRGSNFREKSFAGEATFPKHSPVVPASKIDDFRVIFIYKDPVEALVSRYDHTHCTHIQGDCEASAADWPTLAEYASQGADRMRLRDHFNAFMHPARERSYPVVALNYHKLWDNLPALLVALGLPGSLVDTFPKRSETVRAPTAERRDGSTSPAAPTSAVRTLDSTREGLRKMYLDLAREMSANPAVVVV